MTDSALFTAIGTIYGVGDGATTFNLPDLMGGRVLKGGTPGTTTEAQNPTINQAAINYTGPGGGYDAPWIWGSAGTPGRAILSGTFEVASLSMLPLIKR
jgi:hypothetical protein